MNEQRHGEIRDDDTWCNCQAIPGTVNYPGPWHERGGEPHYPCASEKHTVEGRPSREPK